MHWFQFQTRVRKDDSVGAEEPVTYFLPTENINLAELFLF